MLARLLVNKVLDHKKLVDKFAQHDNATQGCVVQVGGAWL
jgi:hypothetical protein